ncbi:type V CRISPR-associated endonuclease Cas1 [Candidatus Woesearchaeota archaeon]|nr:type V CRISPR-associated endonuclease Cas1 [Candidatus Woesearchaeota archaeon]
MAKQVIYLESDEFKKLRFKNSNLVLCEEKNILIQHSCHKIFLVFVCGEFTITSVLIKKIKKLSVPFIFLNYRLSPFFSIIPDNKGNFLLRKKQYDNPNELHIAKHVIGNKIENQIYLMQSLRYKTKKECQSIRTIKLCLNNVTVVNDGQELLGIEGTASRVYFETYFKNMGFKGRKPRCRSDIYNLLFDIGYHYLFNFIEANLELYGFDTYCGFYHKLFFQRKSLVCDIIEPFRCIIDRRIRKSYNLKQIGESDFGKKNGQFYIKRDFNKKYSKIFLKEILENKEEIFMYIQSFYRTFMKGRKEYPKFSLEV